VSKTFFTLWWILCLNAIFYNVTTIEAELNLSGNKFMNQTSAIILAGGAGKRVGGRDKGLISWQGKTMVEHVITALRPQVTDIVISCNRNLTTYEQFSLPLAVDTHGGYQGPLAGLLSAYPHCESDFILAVPCDCPRLPDNLVEKLHQSLQENEISVVDDGKRLQPLFLLARKSCFSSINSYLAEGNHSVRGWLSGHQWITADFSDYQEGFLNLNQLESQPIAKS
jgi:molybdenum cofactor guanylyltransferase